MSQGLQLVPGGLQFVPGGLQPVPIVWKAGVRAGILAQNNTMHLFLIVVLIMHIAGGTVALFSGACAIFAPKGGRAHRLAGKTYFWSMTTVFVSALILAIAHDNPFLFAIGFFSYYLVVKGYRNLYLRKLGEGQRAAPLDWGIVIVASLFSGYLLWWGISAFLGGVRFGIVSSVFGAVALRSIVYDIRKFSGGPVEKMHWLYGHLSGMGGAYIATLTAVVVVNVQIGPGWVWWLLPVSIGLPLIEYTIRKYRKRFAAEGEPVGRKIFGVDRF